MVLKFGVLESKVRELWESGATLRGNASLPSLSPFRGWSSSPRSVQIQLSVTLAAEVGSRFTTIKVRRVSRSGSFCHAASVRHVGSDGGRIDDVAGGGAEFDWPFILESPNESCWKRGTHRPRRAAATSRSVKP